MRFASFSCAELRFASFSCAELRFASFPWGNIGGGVAA
ncbi:MAG: hypothetical protein ACK4Z7_12355 [Novosphingobium sp.]